MPRPANRSHGCGVELQRMAGWVMAANDFGVAQRRWPAAPCPYQPTTGMPDAWEISAYGPHGHVSSYGSLEPVEGAR
jgi:hypothetical protein